MPPRQKILYLMHVHWDWIKQRPHFVAEYLNKEFNITVVFGANYRKSTISNDTNDLLTELIELSGLPYGRFRLISRLNSLVYRHKLKQYIRDSDIVWVTYPYLYEWVRGILPDTMRLVYDCMDDALEAPDVTKKLERRNSLFTLEGALLKRCDVVFVSSDNLRTKILDRYHVNPSVVHVVNNAIHISNKNQANHRSEEFIKIFNTLQSIYHKKIIYLGTIGKWIDFDLILESLEACPQVTYIFIGPLCGDVPKHERLLVFPPIPHDEVSEVMKLSDALVMPFKVSDFIQGVNPVKVYEYIFAQKPAIVVSYKETEKFSRFVHLYTNKNDYISIVNRVMAGTLKLIASPEECIQYINENTWANRVESMEFVLRSLLNQSRY
jgi:teichuronic acid biosynthesis glycosyltransferase TuaH